MADWMVTRPADEATVIKAGRPLVLEACLVIATIGVVLIVASHVLGNYLGLTSGTCALAIYAAISVIALGNLHYHAHAHFGIANAITTARAAITSVVGAVMLEVIRSGQIPDERSLWLIGGVVAFALALDGADGYLARRLGMESRFGARFDMEVDALLILLLSIFLFMIDKTGWWILAIGSMRYAYVAAQWAMPALRAELPPSMRRKIVCVVQGIALCSMIVPATSVAAATSIGAVALALLTYSFAVDTIFLLKSGKSQSGAA